MARTYNKQQREAMAGSIWELRRTGLSMGTIAKRLGCSPDTVHNLLKWKAAEVAAETRAIVEEIKAEQTARLDYVIEEALESWRKSKRPATTEKIVEKRMGVAGKSETLEPQGRGGALKRTRREYGEPFRDDEDDPYGEDVPAGTYLAMEEDEDAIEEDKPVAKAERDPFLPVMERTETKTVTVKTGNTAYLAAAMAAMEAQRRIWGLDAPKDDKLTIAGSVTVVEYPEGI